MLSRILVCTFSSSGWMTVHSSSLALSCGLDALVHVLAEFFHAVLAVAATGAAGAAGTTGAGRAAAGSACGGGGGGGASSWAKAWDVPSQRTPAVGGGENGRGARFHAMVDGVE